MGYCQEENEKLDQKKHDELKATVKEDWDFFIIDFMK